MEQLIYLDNAATTRTDPRVVEEMLPYFTEKYGNPSSVYSFAAANKEDIAGVRAELAGILGARPEEIYFTAGGTESDNWALKATADAYGHKGKHIITTKIEHHAILHTCEYLEKKGFEVTYLDVDENGIVDLEQLKASIRPDTILISVMFANNEIGTLEPIEEIGRLAKEKGNSVPHRRGAGLRPRAHRRGPDGHRYALRQRAQAFGAQGDWLPLYQKGREDPLLYPRRGPGEKAPGGDGECSRHHRPGSGGQGSAPPPWSSGRSGRAP